MHTLSINIQTNIGILLTKWIYQQGSCQSNYQRAFWSPIMQHIHFMRYFYYLTCNMHIHSGVFNDHIFAVHISFIHTCLLESEFHVIHLFAFIWKAISCHTLMGKAEIFSLLIHILKIHFMPYVPILRSIFAPFLAHVYIGKALGYLLNTRTLILSLVTYSTSSRCKEPSRCNLHQMRA